MKRAIILLLILLIGCSEKVGEKTVNISSNPVEPVLTNGTNCTEGWICVKYDRKGYQFSNCVIAKEMLCPGNCSNGECLPPAKVNDTFGITEGIGKMGEITTKAFDFSEKEFLKDGVAKLDLAIKLHSIHIGYTFFTAYGNGKNIWIIDKKITEAKREDCVEKMPNADESYYLYSEKTACVRTQEGNIAMLGGFWPTIPNEQTNLIWRYYSK